MIKKVIVTACMLIMLLTFSNIKAENINTADIYEEIKIVSSEKYKLIEELLGSLGKEITDIDKKIIEARKMEEFETYPTIRLEIDTPFFGLANIIDSKLQITKDISTIDMIQSYGIKNIIKDKTIKIIDYKIGNFFIVTKNIEITDEISEKDADIIISKLFSYLNQVKTTNRYLDKKLNNAFYEFFVDKKVKVKENISAYSTIITNNIKNILEKLDLLNVMENNEHTEEFFKIYEEFCNLKIQQKNSLLNIDELKELQDNFKDNHYKFNEYLIKLDTAVFKYNKELTNEKIENYSKKLYSYIYNLNEENKLEYNMNKLDNYLKNIIGENLENIDVYEKYRLKTDEFHKIIKEYIKFSTIYYSDSTNKLNVSLKEVNKDEIKDNLLIQYYINVELVDILNEMSENYIKSSIVFNLNYTNKVNEIITKIGEINDSTKQVKESN